MKSHLPLCVLALVLLGGQLSAVWSYVRAVPPYCMRTTCECGCTSGEQCLKCAAAP